MQDDSYGSPAGCKEWVLTRSFRWRRWRRLHWLRQWRRQRV